MATFLQLATPYARMGIPVFPLLPKSKLPPSWMTDFPFYATTHLGQIKLWSEKMPDAMQTERGLRAAFQIATHEAVFLHSHVERSGAGFIDRRGAVLLG